jgi:hypothetical protein
MNLCYANTKIENTIDIAEYNKQLWTNVIDNKYYINLKLVNLDDYMKWRNYINNFDYSDDIYFDPNNEQLIIITNDEDYAIVIAYCMLYNLIGIHNFDKSIILFNEYINNIKHDNDLKNILIKNIINNKNIYENGTYNLPNNKSLNNNLSNNLPNNNLSNNLSNNLPNNKSLNNNLPNNKLLNNNLSNNELLNNLPNNNDSYELLNNTEEIKNNNNEIINNNDEIAAFNNDYENYDNNNYFSFI